MGMALPLSAICLVIAWFVLLLVFLARRGCMKQDTEQALAVKSVIREEWRKLGRIQLVEVELIILFFIMALLWLTRKPTPDGGGWAEWF
ncbi:solute carrier family 13 member 1, partial [Aplysia californica]|uniref:Solute carrier family 13 member 1 n=1 Tax=Aplysia californica TaxID=6500 RepID=A0ABM1AFB4_APLCA